jgi:preprotein translocase subunit YajC
MTDTNQTDTIIAGQTAETQATTTNTGFLSNETIMNFLPIILIFAVFYFFIIRPQIKKQKDQEALIKSSKKGDKVIVAGGLIGKIVKEKEGDIIVIELAQGVQVEALRSSIISIVKLDNDASAKPSPTAKKK